jgi:hypothetical protein
MRNESVRILRRVLVSTQQACQVEKEVGELYCLYNFSWPRLPEIYICTLWMSVANIDRFVHEPHVHCKTIQKNKL